MPTRLRRPVATEPILPRASRDLPSLAELSAVPRPRFSRGQWLALAVLTLVAAVLRILHLGTWSLWLDEAHTWRDATIPFSGETGFVHQARALYPLAFVALRGLLAQGLASHEAALRMPFALVGIASVPLLAVAGRRLVGAQSAIAAAALCALNPWHVYWSQNARGYIFVFLCAAWAANRAGAYAANNRLRDLFAAWAAILLGTLSHPTGLLLALAFATFLVLRTASARKTSVRIGLGVGILVVAVALPWLVHLLPFQDFVEAKADPNLTHFAETVAYYFRPSLLLAGAIGLALARGPLSRLRVLLLSCFAIVPILALGVIGAQVVKTTARYALCALPIWLWLASYGMLRLADLVLGRDPVVAWPRRAAAAMLPLLLVGEFTVRIQDYFVAQSGDRGRWREACQFAVAHAGKAKLRVLTVSYATAVYYLRRDQWSSPTVDLYPRVVVQTLEKWDIASGQKGAGGTPLHEPGGRNRINWELEQAAKDAADFLVIVSWPELVEKDDDGEIRGVLAERFELVHYEPCWVGPKDDSVYVYAPRRP